jgi:hypothetical protein
MFYPSARLKMTPKKLKTNKLFYGEWPYKISTGIVGASLLRARGIDYLKKWCMFPGINSHWARRKHMDPATLLDYVVALEPFLSSDVKLRIDQDQISIFVKDSGLCQEIATALSKFVISITEPTNTQELVYMADNKKVVLCNHIPKMKYQFRVVFQDIPIAAAANILAWAEKYDADCLEIPTGTRRHFSGDRGFWPSECYFYARDRSMVMMITLASGGKIRRVEEYVPRSSINKHDDQETICQH